MVVVVVVVVVLDLRWRVGRVQVRRGRARYYIFDGGGGEAGLNYFTGYYLLDQTCVSLFG